MTELFKDWVSLLKDKRLNENLGTCKTFDKEKEEHKPVVSEPVTWEVETSRVTRDGRPTGEISNRMEEVPIM